MKKQQKFKENEFKFNINLWAGGDTEADLAEALRDVARLIKKDYGSGDADTGNLAYHFNVSEVSK